MFLLRWMDRSIAPSHPLNPIPPHRKPPPRPPPAAPTTFIMHSANQSSPHLTTIISRRKFNRRHRRRHRHRRRLAASPAHLRPHPPPLIPVATSFLSFLPPQSGPSTWTSSRRFLLSPSPSPSSSPSSSSSSSSSSSPSPSSSPSSSSSSSSSPSSPPSPPPSPSSSSSSNPAPLIGGIAAVAVFLVCGSIFFYWWWRQRSGSNIEGEQTATATAAEESTEAPPSREAELPRPLSPQDYVPPSVRGPRSFTYSELAVATDNFSESRILGRGGFGAVYKGWLEGADYIAVKRIAEDSEQGMKEFVAEVSIISEIRHRNLVKLRGWCEEPKGRLFVVYDYLANGSVDGMLFDEGRCGALTWERRLGIARGVGAALQYLHEGCDRVIVHRDVKASNVLLDEGFAAKLGDFGLSRRAREGERGHTTITAGTPGYMAPEIFTTGRATTESDVYSFGAVLAELATGRKALLLPNRTLLVDWVWDLYGRNRLLEAADHRLAGRFDVLEMERLLIVALACSHPYPARRPTASDAVNYLQGSLPLPAVPFRKPAIA